jgi:putative effector of murein hydrolase LrgA (UPF0299 family)
MGLQSTELDKLFHFAMNQALKVKVNTINLLLQSISFCSRSIISIESYISCLIKTMNLLFVPATIITEFASHYSIVKLLKIAPTDYKLSSVHFL